MYLSSGNLRMDIPTFSLPAIISCGNFTPNCSRYCYARKAEKLYPNALKSRIRNLNDSKREDFVHQMIELISNKKSKYIRIHESGDFYSQKYLDKWIRIAESLPDKVFLAYTQMYSLDYSKKPDNMIIYWSIWPDSRNPPKNGLRAFVIDPKNRLIGNSISNSDLVNAHVCKKGGSEKIKCNNCLYCFKGKGNVVFKLH